MRFVGNLEEKCLEILEELPGDFAKDKKNGKIMNIIDQHFSLGKTNSMELECLQMMMQ